jgi:uncharacterized protein YdeI (YjbR/CyaY-like superfamily)
MSGQLKLTAEQIVFARTQTEKRREALKAADRFPTVAELAAQMRCTPRYLQKILAGKVR